jgi:hypothetical protein
MVRPVGARPHAARVRALIDGVVDRGDPVLANRILALVRKMLNFAVDHDWIEANPAARITKPTREVSPQQDSAKFKISNVLLWIA